MIYHKSYFPFHTALSSFLLPLTEYTHGSQSSCERSKCGLTTLLWFIFKGKVPEVYKIIAFILKTYKLHEYLSANVTVWQLVVLFRVKSPSFLTAFPLGLPHPPMAQGHTIVTSTNITATLKNRAAGSFEDFINLYPNLTRHIQEDSNQYQ